MDRVRADAIAQVAAGAHMLDINAGIPQLDEAALLAQMPTLDEVRAHFEAAGVARQKWPEELHEADDFPRTASGKVQKFRVRQDIAAAVRQNIGQ